MIVTSTKNLYGTYGTILYTLRNFQITGFANLRGEVSIKCTYAVKIIYQTILRYRTVPVVKYSLSVERIVIPQYYYYRHCNIIGRTRNTFGFLMTFTHLRT